MVEPPEQAKLRWILRVPVRPEAGVHGKRRRMPRTRWLAKSRIIKFLGLVLRQLISPDCITSRG